MPSMTQKDFSNTVKEYLDNHHPDFLQDVSMKDDESFDCSIMNQTAEFSVWIATYNCEITLGLEDRNGDSNCHTHMSFYGNDVLEQLEAMSNYLANILFDKLIAYRSNEKGFSWTYDPQQVLEERTPDESIVFYKWTDS